MIPFLAILCCFDQVSAFAIKDVWKFQSIVEEQCLLFCLQIGGVKYIISFCVLISTSSTAVMLKNIKPRPY